MRFVDALLLVALLGGGVWAMVMLGRRLLGAQPRWRAVSHTTPDGTVEVSIERAGEPPRIVKAIPPGLDALDFASDFQIAIEDAEQQAQLLNRTRQIGR